MFTLEHSFNQMKLLSSNPDDGLNYAQRLLKHTVEFLKIDFNNELELDEDRTQEKLVEYLQHIKVMKTEYILD
jgi:hypothetical protein